MTPYSPGHSGFRLRPATRSTCPSVPKPLQTAAVTTIEADQPGIDRGGEDAVAGDRDTSIREVAVVRIADLQIDAPDFGAGLRVEGDDEAPGRRQVQAVRRIDRCGLERGTVTAGPTRLGRLTRVVRPRDSQTSDGVRGDAIGTRLRTERQAGE